MQIETWWPRLTAESRDWLVKHHGEPLDPDVKRDVLEVTRGDLDASWWAGEPTDGGGELTDEAVDWISEVADGEHPTP